MANTTTSPEELFNAKNIAILLKRMDKDLAANIVLSGVSLSTQKLIETIQACLIASEERYKEKASVSKKAEEMVEKVMSQYDPAKTLKSSSELDKEE